jgi:hypothetical protein
MQVNYREVAIRPINATDATEEEVKIAEDKAAAGAEMTAITTTSAPKPTPPVYPTGFTSAPLRRLHSSVHIPQHWRMELNLDGGCPVYHYCHKVNHFPPVDCEVTGLTDWNKPCYQ